MRYLMLAALAAAAEPAGAATYELKTTPQTVAWGHYDATDKPVLTIRSGDTVVIHTLLTNSPAGLEKAGVAPAQIEPALRAVYDGVPASARGPGGHILTGPIAIAGAEPGDMLEVRRGEDHTLIQEFPAGACFVVEWNPAQLCEFVQSCVNGESPVMSPGTYCLECNTCIDVDAYGRITKIDGVEKC